MSLPLGGRRRRAAAAGRQRRHRAARRGAGAAARPRSRSARCWSRKCTTASRTTCRAWPGCCSRTRSASPQVASMLTESVGQVQAIAQVYGLQVGAGGPLRVASVLQAIGVSVQRTFGAQRRRRTRRRAAARAGAARGRIDPDRADHQRAADQRRQAQRRRRRALPRSMRTTPACACAIAEPRPAAGRVQPGAVPGRRVRPRPGARAAAAAQRRAQPDAARRRGARRVAAEGAERACASARMPRDATSANAAQHRHMTAARAGSSSSTTTGWCWPR